MHHLSLRIATNSADVTLMAPETAINDNVAVTAWSVKVDTVHEDFVAYDTLGTLTLTAGDYQIMWQAADGAGNISESAVQSLAVTQGYEGSVVSNPESYDASHQDFYHIYNLNGESIQVMRLSVSDNVAGENADLASVEAWLADNSSWQYATSLQLSSLAFFFENNTEQFAEFNGWGDGEQWQILTQTADSQLGLYVSDTGFTQVTDASN